MSKKIDINKLLSTGSAKQRVVLLFYHFNIKEAIDKNIPVGEHKLPLTDSEATALLNSFTNEKEIKIYNQYRELSLQIIQAMRWLNLLYKTFQTTYWKYRAYYSEEYYKKKKTGYPGYLEDLEDTLIGDYSTALEYYTALKIYIKESGYKDKFIIGAIDEIYKLLKLDWSYDVRTNGDKDEALDLAEVEPDEEAIKDILAIEFNLEYIADEE